MAKINRVSLKNRFKNGSMPSETDFQDLIDSSLNIIDEGFNKSADTGFEVAQLGKSGKLMSFFENISVKSPLWSIGLDPGQSSLVFSSQKIPSVLTLASRNTADGSDEEKACIGVNNPRPAYELDVDGVVAARGRIGAPGRKKVPADGKWHDLTDPMGGCQAFEIMAGAGEKSSGRYALLHAFALNAYGDKAKIDKRQAYYDSRCNQLELRWQGGMDDFRLQMRSKCAYVAPGSAEVFIRYHLTRLWFDPYMAGSASPGVSDD